MLNKKQKSRSYNSNNLNTQFRRGATTQSKQQREEFAQRRLATERQESIARKLKRHQSRIKVFGSLLAVLMIVMFWRSTITGTTISSTQKLTDASVDAYSKSATEAIVNNSFMGQSWSVNRQAAETDIQKKFPEVSAVKIRFLTPISKFARLNLSFRKPVFLWKDSGGEIRYLDKQGVLFTENRTDEDIKQLIEITDESGSVLQSGNPALSRSTTEMIGNMPSQLKSLYPKGIKSVSIPLSTREVRVYFNGYKYYVKFTTERTLSDQAGELKSVLNYLAKKKQNPSAYIDLRLEHKSYIK